MVEQATSADLSKPNLPLNKQICEKLIDDPSLYFPLCYPSGRSAEAANCIRARIIKKNPRIQCLALELLDVAVRTGTPTLHAHVGTPEFINILVRLLKVPDLSPIVTSLRRTLELGSNPHSRPCPDVRHIFQKAGRGLPCVPGGVQ